MEVRPSSPGVLCGVLNATSKLIHSNEKNIIRNEKSNTYVYWTLL